MATPLPLNDLEIKVITACIKLVLEDGFFSDATTIKQLKNIITKLDNLCS